MHKIIPIFVFASALCSCSGMSNRDEEELEQFERQLNIDTEARIDAAYQLISQECDSLLIHRVPKDADSLYKIGIH